MHIIEIAPLDNGAHRNQSGGISIIPEGWAMVPSNIEIPETFPFINIKTEGNIVVEMTAAPVPPIPEPEPAQPTLEEQVIALKAAIEMLCMENMEV